MLNPQEVVPNEALNHQLVRLQQERSNTLDELNRLGIHDIERGLEIYRSVVNDIRSLTQRSKAGVFFDNNPLLPSETALERKEAIRDHGHMLEMIQELKEESQRPLISSLLDEQVRKYLEDARSSLIVEPKGDGERSEQRESQRTDESEHAANEIIRAKSGDLVLPPPNADQAKRFKKESHNEMVTEILIWMPPHRRQTRRTDLPADDEPSRGIGSLTITPEGE
ncbi:MAG: hypothetical protein Q9159_007502 [Coniocarpon cinnabarinum]